MCSYCLSHKRTSKEDTTTSVCKAVDEVADISMPGVQLRKEHG